jgi:hypothetical protein
MALATRAKGKNVDDDEFRSTIELGSTQAMYNREVGESAA